MCNNISNMRAIPRKRTRKIAGKKINQQILCSYIYGVCFLAILHFSHFKHVIPHDAWWNSLSLLHISRILHMVQHMTFHHIYQEKLLSHSPHAMLRLWHSMHIVSYGAILWPAMISASIQAKDFHLLQTMLSIGV